MCVCVCARAYVYAWEEVVAGLNIYSYSRRVYSRVYSLAIGCLVVRIREMGQITQTTDAVHARS